MRPRPTREWVMLELEKLNVRVVSGRVKGGSDSEGEDDEDEDKITTRGASTNPYNGNVTSALLNTNRGLLDDQDYLRGSRNANINGGVDPIIPPHRPLVGGGSAAAYEAARADHYRRLAEQKKSKGGKDNADANNLNSPDQQHRATDANSNMLQNGGSALLSGSVVSGVGGGALSLSVNPHQHYEMLKLHHMNLLNEIQETTLMMNLYQQQQLQQRQHQQLMMQQQQLRQERSNTDSSFLAQQQRMISSLGGGMNAGIGQLGLAGSLGTLGPMESMIQQQQNMINPGVVIRRESMPGSRRSSLGMQSVASGQSIGGNDAPEAGGEESNHARKERLMKIKAEIAERQRLLLELEDKNDTSSSGGRDPKRLRK